MVQPLSKTIWQFFKRLNINYHATLISPLGTGFRNVKSMPLSTVPPNTNVHASIRKINNVHVHQEMNASTEQYYSPVSKNEDLVHTTVRTYSGNTCHVKEVSLYDSTYMKCPPNRQNHKRKSRLVTGVAWEERT